MTVLCCKLCGSPNVKFVFSEKRDGVTFASYHCRACDLHQTLGDIPSISPDYVDLEEGDLTEEHLSLQRGHKQPAFEQWRDAVAATGMEPSPGRRPKVLDIGCGVGGFLDFAKSLGFETFGFDASRAQIDLAQQNHEHTRLATSIGEYVQQLGENHQFDLVTMWDVLEHIREPQAFLQSLHSYLHEKSVFFASVPSGAPTYARVAIGRLTGRPLGLIPWEHVFYHTPRSLTALLEKSGFEVLKTEGVAAYVREPSLFEYVRRAVHMAARRSPYALQISVYAQPR